MLPLLKKKTEAAKGSAVPPWHPNFRNFERLPDTKVVRTAFFINAGAILVAAAALLAFVYQEYQLRDLRLQVEDWQAQIDRNQATSSRGIALFKKFQAEAAKVREINAFSTGKPLISDLLIQLGQTLPGNIAIDNFELRESGLRLVASVRGAPDQASGRASTYLEQLRANEALTTWFDDIALLNINRDAQTGRLTVEYFLKFRKAAKK